MESGGRFLALVSLFSLVGGAVSASNFTGSEGVEILLDTDDYATLSLLGAEGESEIWLSLVVEDGVEVEGSSFMKWKETLKPDPSQHEFSVCGELLDNQQSWMVTHYLAINKTGVSELRFNMSLNTDLDIQCCNGTVDIRLYQTDEPNEDARRDPNEYVSGPIPFDNFSEGTLVPELSNLVIHLEDTAGLYLAFVVSTPGTCIAITHIALFYFVCPGQDRDLIVFPETVAPTTTDPESILIDPNCTANAVLTSAPGTHLECGDMGVWQTNGVCCECDRGYYYSEDFSTPTCEACPPGTYKNTVGNEDCVLCPANSYSDDEASIFCPCNEGFGRFLPNATSFPCTGGAGVVNLTAKQICSGVRVDWSPLMDGEMGNDVYKIKFLRLFEIVSSAAGVQPPFTQSVENFECPFTYGVRLSRSDVILAFTSVMVNCSMFEVVVDEIFYGTNTDTGTVDISLKGQPVNGVDTFRITSADCGVESNNSQGYMYVSSEDLQTTRLNVNKFDIVSVTSMSGDDDCYCKSISLENLLIVDVILPRPKMESLTYQMVMVTFSHQVSDLALSKDEGKENCSIRSAFPDKSANVTCTNLTLDVPHEVRATGLVLMTDGTYLLKFSLDLLATGREDPTVEDSVVDVNMIVGLAVGASFLLAIIVIVAVTCACCASNKRKLKAAREEKMHEFELSLKRESMLSRQQSNIYESPLNGVEPALHRNSSIQAQGVKARHLSQLGMNSLILSRQIRLLDSIGCGEFGVVYKGHFFAGADKMPKTVAVKTLKGTFSNEEVDSFLSESILMKQLSHPNVMGLLGVCLDAGPSPYLIMPFMAEGSLLNYLKKRRSTFVLAENEDENIKATTTQTLMSMCLQIAKGMEHLASKKIIHRDLAARNCMIDENGIIKVADFGLTKDVYEKMYFRENKKEGAKLPFKWMALESLQDGVFSEKTDVWSYGVTCWEVFSGGKIPYPGMGAMGLAKCIAQGERMDIPDNAACSSEIFEMIMLNCWREFPEDRPTFLQLVANINTSLMEMADYVDIDIFQLPTKDC